MADLDLGRLRVDVDLVVFDKDGTLVDFHHMWGGKAGRYVDGLLDACGRSDGALREALFQALGYDSQSLRTRADSPLAVASMPKLRTISATVLYQHGIGWHTAEELADAAFDALLAAHPTADLVRPLGDVAGLFRALRGAGVRLALATSDDRAATLATLPLLGVSELVDDMVCGDDPLPNKPDPEGLLHLARTLGVAPSRMLMVGDSVCDVQTGRNAGVAASVAVLSGTGDPESLALHADVVLDTVHGIRPAAH